MTFDLKPINHKEINWNDYKITDLDILAVIWSDPEVTRFLPSRGIPISQEQTKKALASFLEHWQNRNYGIWAIIEKAGLHYEKQIHLFSLDALYYFILFSKYENSNAIN